MMKKIIQAIVIVALIILIRPVKLFVTGHFHPHQVWIDNVNIRAPKSTFLQYAWVDGVEVQSFLSPLLFSNTEQYTLLNNTSIELWFRSIDPENRKPFLTITATRPIAQLDFEKLISMERKKIQSTVAMRNNKCIAYYHKKTFHELNFLIKSNSSWFSLSSDQNKTVNDIMTAFCGVMSEV